jgi:lipoprotein-releasing system permease protein
MPWSLRLALKYLFPTGRRLSFFTVLSVVGMALGVAVLWVVQSVINGFGHQIREKLVEINGPIQVVSTEPLENVEAVQAQMLSVGGLRSVVPFVAGMTMIQSKDRIAFPWVRGVEIQRCEEVFAFGKFIKKGGWEEGCVLLSRSLADALSVDVGDEVDIYSPLMLNAIGRDEILLPTEHRVSGIFETGWADVDKQTILCDLETAQEVYGLGNAVHGIAASVDDSKTSVSAACGALNRILPPPLRARTWMEVNEDLLFVLRMEKTMMLFVVLFIVLVAAFSISSGLITTVVRKRREIALLTIMGAGRKQLMSIFAWQSTILGLLGIALGFVGGSIALLLRNDILEVLSRCVLPKDMLWNFYSFAQLPSRCSARDAVVIAVSTLAMALGASIIPAWKAGRLRSTEVLRGD